MSLAKAFWSRSAASSLARSLPARSSIEGAPQIDRGARAFRRRFARQLLAHDQAERIGQRRLGTVARLGEPARVAARFELRGEIVRDAFHGQRADGFDARLFGRFEHRGRVGAMRAELLVDLVFVIGAPQRIGVARAAHDGDFVRRQIARGQRQARLQTLERRRLGAEIDFELRLARERAHRRRDGALERFGGFSGFIWTRGE